MTSVKAVTKSPSSRRAWIEIFTVRTSNWSNMVSPSSRRAWIEIVWKDCDGLRELVALLAEGVDRNWTCPSAPAMPCMSPSSRRAWIEISMIEYWGDRLNVALLAEGVDRNQYGHEDQCQYRGSPSSRRAWIEIPYHDQREGGHESPSSRRAWIEIPITAWSRNRPRVALLAEGVDRNYQITMTFNPVSASPSSRRAWIEIVQP